MKKILSLLLVALMIVGMLPMTAINANAAEPVTFQLGANGSATHYDGSEKTAYTETVSGYTLSITGGTKMYTGARDAKGNSCIKLGTSKAVGGFTFTVPSEVSEVVICVAKYKSGASKVNINGTDYTLTKNSNDGAYDEITVDTSSNKTVKVTTVASSYRAMVNSITFAFGDDACAHANTTTTTADATCTAVGSVTVVCDDCGETVSTEELPAIHDTLPEGSVCSICGWESEIDTPDESEPTEPEATEPTEEVKITFELGADGTATHNDGKSATTYTETVDGYTLDITDGAKMYTGAIDATGNGCIKLGTSSAVGGFTFTVPSDVTQVIIRVAKYKANTTNFSVNGTEYALNNASNNGAYDEITVDTSSSKTVTVTTVSGGVRAMVNSITFVCGKTDHTCQWDEGTVTKEATCTTDGERTYSCTVDGCKITKTEKIEATGHTYDENGNCTVCGITPAQVVDAAYALATNATLEGTYTLTGVISAVNTPYDSGYGNVTVTIDVIGVTDKPIMCYRMKGEGADLIGTGDTITVTGVLKNYNGTVEFDAGCTLDSWENTGSDFVRPETPEEIVNAAYGLEAGASLEGGSYTLTGVITSVRYCYSASYNNITVTIQIGDMADKTIECYRLAGDGIDQICVGDTITVTGNLNNYNGAIQFAQGSTLDSYTINNGHTTVVDEAVAANCTATGLTEGSHCSACTLVLIAQEEVAALGHKVDDPCVGGTCSACGEEVAAAHTIEYVAAVVPANCQETGHEEYWHCTACDAYFGDAEGSYQQNPAWINYTGEHVRPEDAIVCAVVPCELCGEDTYGESCDRGDAPVCQDATCVNCGETVYGWGCNYNTGDEEVPLPLCQPGTCVYCHKEYDKLYDCENGSWAPCTYDGECSYGCGKQFPATGVHIAENPCEGGICQLCWEVNVEPSHNFVDGTCSNCGATDPNAGPTVDASLNVNKIGLSFQDYIGLEFRINKPSGYSSVYAIASQEVWDNTAKAFKTVETTLEAQPSGTKYYKFNQAVLANAMTEQVTFTVYGEKNGVLYKSATVVTSVQDQAIEKSAALVGTSDNLVTILANMLNYGAALQTRFEHNTDNLPNPGEYASYATTTAPEFTATSSTSGAANITVDKVGLSMQDKVVMEFRFVVPYANISKYEARYTIAGSEEVFTIDGTAFTSNTAKTKSIARISVKALDMRKMHTVALYDKETGECVSVTQVYSVEALGKAHVGTVNNDLVIALMRYVDSVAASF